MNVTYYLWEIALHLEHFQNRHESDSKYEYFLLVGISTPNLVWVQ